MGRLDPCRALQAPARRDLTAAHQRPRTVAFTTSLALSENISMARHPVMLRNVDALIGFFVGVGLPLEDAYHACMETIRHVVGFVELQDVLHDRPPAHLDPADLERLPPSWLLPEAGAEGDSGPELPHLSRLGELKPPSPDAQFEFSLTLLTEGIAAHTVPDEAQS